MEFEQEKDVKQFTSFEEMDLKEELLRGIYAYGFEKPSKIQQLAIEPFLKGKNIVVRAQSGTGKTASYAIPILHKVDPSINAIQALILVPIRELSMGVCKVYCSRHKSRSAYGISWRVS